MESDAFSESQNILPTDNLLLSVSNIPFVCLKEAFSVELFLKPYCSVTIILFWLMCWYNLVYITFPRIFEKDVSNGIGLKLVISILSPFLCYGFISENFDWEGKIPKGSDLLHMYVRGDVMKGVFTFRIFIGIPSYP
jgi:hypothetical protein